MNYELSRIQNVTRNDESRSNSVPFDFIAAKFDQTDMYLPEDSFRDFAREMIVDRSPDTVVLAEDEPASKTSRGALNLRLNGHRGNAEDPSNAEAFLGDLGHENDNILDDLHKVVDQNKFRTQRYQTFRPDDEGRETSGSWSQKDINKAHININSRFKREAKIFTPSFTSILYKSGKGAVDTLASRCNTIADHIGIRPGTYEGEKPANETQNAAKNARVGERSYEKGLGRSASSIDNDFAVALIGPNKKSMRAGDITKARKEGRESDAIISDGNATKLYKSVASLMNNVTSARASLVNEANFGLSKTHVSGRNVAQGDHFIAKISSSHDVQIAEEAKLLLAKVAANKDISRAKRQALADHTAALEFNAKTIARNMAAKNGSVIHREIIADTTQFSSSQIAKNGKNGLKYVGNTLTREALHVDIIHVDLKTHVYSNSHIRPDSTAGRSDIAYDDEGSRGDNVWLTPGRNRAPEMEDKFADRVQDVQQSAAASARPVDIGRRKNTSKYSGAHVDRSSRDDSREL